MVESRWQGLDDKELRYQDRTWRLTGTVDVLDGGELLAVDAREVDDVRGSAATLYFGLDGEPKSLNPGNLGEQFERLERTDDGQTILVRTDGGTYRYELHRMTYD